MKCDYVLELLCYKEYFETLFTIKKPDSTMYKLHFELGHLLSKCCVNFHFDLIFLWRENLKKMSFSNQNFNKECYRQVFISRAL